MKGVYITPTDELSVPRLTEEERRWIGKLQRVLSSCPSGRLGLVTIGDPGIQVVDDTTGSELADGEAGRDGVVLADLVGGPRVHGVSG